MEYELLYIVPATMTDEDVGTAEGNVKALLEKYGATIQDTRRLGKFRLAYPINKVRHGHYILVNLQAETSSVARIEENLRISRDVLRHLLLRADEVGGTTFDLVQFTEVNVDAAKEDRPRRRREDGEAKKVDGEDVKAEAAALDEKEKTEEKVPAMGLSDEDLNKKLEAALEGDTEEV